MTERKMITVYVPNPELVKEAQRLGINISAACVKGIEAAIAEKDEIQDLIWGRVR